MYTGNLISYQLISEPDAIAIEVEDDDSQATLSGLINLTTTERDVSKAIEAGEDVFLPDVNIWGEYFCRCFCRLIKLADWLKDSWGDLLDALDPSGTGEVVELETPIKISFTTRRYRDKKGRMRTGIDSIDFGDGYVPGRRRQGATAKTLKERLGLSK